MPRKRRRTNGHAGDRNAGQHRGERVRTGSHGASVKAVATGREAQNSRGKPIPPKPITVIFEFLDSKGTVVGNQEVQVPALKTGETHPIEAKVQATGIAAWRYKTLPAKS